MKVVKFYLILLELICIISALFLIWADSEIECEPWMYKTVLSLSVLAAVTLQREQQYIDTEDEEY